MSQTYTEDDREEALELLGYNRNNIALTSTQTGIPERTLREWRRKHRNNISLPPDPSPAAAAMPVGDSAEALQFVYDQLVQELTRLAASLPEILASAPPYHQLLAITHIIDRVEKLQQIIPQPVQTLRVEYVDPDGSTHDTPFWQRDNE